MTKKTFILIFVIILISACSSSPSDMEESTETINIPSSKEQTAVNEYPLKTNPLPLSADTAANKWNLWANGTRLRGVDLHPCRLYNENGCVQPVSRQDIQDLHDAGANLINASYPGIFTEDAPYNTNPTALAYLDDLLGWAEDAGMYVVIHFRTGPGRNEGAINSANNARFDVWTDQAAHDAWVEMWQFTADRYRNSPVVVGYNLMVEPHPNTLVDPNQTSTPADVQAKLNGTLMDWNAFAVEISTAIRHVDPDTPIIVSSINWASAEWFSVLRPTGDPHTIYSLHAYDPDIYIIQEKGANTLRYPDVVNDYGENITFDKAWLDENYRPVREFVQQNNVPIYVGEFGVVRWVPDAPVFLHDQTDLFEQYGWNNAVYVWRSDEADFDGFNMEYGIDPQNHAPTSDNPLLTVLHNHWAQNVDFPGNPTPAESERWQPPLTATWQWQLEKKIDTAVDAQIFDIDLFENETAMIETLHAQGKKVICYISAGSWEDWRPDKDAFPKAVIGNNYDGWPGEKWLDIRQIDALAPVMRARLDECRAKGFDGVEPDNIDGFTNNTGFPLTAADQLAYNRWLAAEAHARGLSIGLKNDSEQAAELVGDFDWALTEDCFAEDWCADMQPFIAAGKPVFAAEYTDTDMSLADFCPSATALNINAILKNRNLDAWRETCPVAESSAPAVLPSPTPKAETPAPKTPLNFADKMDLWTHGTQLRGANIWQALVIPDLDGLEFKGTGAVGPPFSQADFDALAAAGANYISLSVPGIFTETPPFELDSAVAESLDHLIEMAANADLFVTISVRTGPGRSEFGLCCDGEPDFGPYINDSMWQDAAAQDGWVEMWRATAERYRNTPNVAGYKLMVEPNSAGLLLDIYEPDEFYAQYGGTLYDWNQLYPRLVAAIREVDPATPILIGGNGWSAVPWLAFLKPVDDPRTVYVVHQYEPQDDYTHQEGTKNSYPGNFDTNDDGTRDTFDQAWLKAYLQPVTDFAAEYDVPVTVDEFGVNRWVPGAAQFMDAQMALFEQMGMNMAFWEWPTGWYPFVSDVNDMVYQFGPERSNITPVENDLWAVVQKYWSHNTVRPSNFYADTRSTSITLPAALTRPDGAVQLTDPTPPASDQNPAFAPNAGQMIFTRFKNGYNDGPADLLLLKPDSGAPPTLLTTAPDSDNVNLPGSSWNAATGRIVFSSDREDIDEVWSIAADKTSLRRITHHTDGYFIEPSFSPNGEWIVFERDDAVPDDHQQGSIWKVRANGNDLTQLTDGPGGNTDDRQPNWSPIGDKILFQRRQPGSDDWNVVTMAPDGSNIRGVTTSLASDTDASFSPNGEWIVYSSDEGHLATPNIFIIPTAGGDPQRVTHSETYEDGAPSWSPDGQWIAFESHLGQDEDTPSNVWLITAPVINR